MNNAALRVVQAIGGDEQLALFAGRLAAWLIHDLNKDNEAAPEFTEARAKALLQESGLLDEPALHTFEQLAADSLAARVALYDLIGDSEVAGSEAITELATVGPLANEPQPIPWLSLAVAAYAWKNGYPLYQLDPSSPPLADSPAGQLLRRAAHFFRRQIQRSPTERDRLGRKLSQPPAGAPSLEEMPDAESAIPPLPPIFRSPIPVRYPEVARETVRVAADEAEDTPPAATVTRGDPLVITEDDLSAPEQAEEQPPAAGSPLTIEPEDVSPAEPAGQPGRPPSPMPPTAVVMPNSAVQSRPGFSVAIRQMLGHEEMTTTRLRVKVQEYPDGPGLYGLQVKVSCQGIKSHVAGITGRDGDFTCDLPVRLESGLTYDVDVTWPRHIGGETERKSITLNGDRTEFLLPFYRNLSPD